MAGENITAHPYVGYVQSANTLFHFMKEFGYLKTILRKRAIVPRYCIETMDYLHIRNGELDIQEVAVLQKCFCDIPLHKLADSFSVIGTGQVYDDLTSEEQFRVQHQNTHFDFYGGFAIGFSKDWSERKRLQPIHYLNTESAYSNHFERLLPVALAADDLPDEYVDDVLYRLAFIKPLRGIMQRNFDRGEGKVVKVDIYKNFHDECEWRFVPEHTVTESLDLSYVIANPQIVKNGDTVWEMNKSLEDERYHPLWLDFDYDDIRYLIVPDNGHRIDLISAICEIPENKFSGDADADLQKKILISKILVLDEVRRDW